MDSLQTTIDDVAGWDENEPSGPSILKLRSGLALRAARDDPRHEAWRHAATQHQGPVYVQFDPATKAIAALYMGQRQLAHSAEASSEGKAIITFEIAPSFYYVNEGRPGGREMIAQLRDAVKRHQPVFVVSHPSTLEILDVRPVGK
jgi:hypothetical protein